MPTNWLSRWWQGWLELQDRLLHVGEPEAATPSTYVSPATLAAQAAAEKQAAMEVLAGPVEAMPVAPPSLAPPPAAVTRIPALVLLRDPVTAERYKQQRKGPLCAGCPTLLRVVNASEVLGFVRVTGMLSRLLQPGMAIQLQHPSFRIRGRGQCGPGGCGVAARSFRIVRLRLAERDIYVGPVPQTVPLHPVS